MGLCLRRVPKLNDAHCAGSQMDASEALIDGVRDVSDRSIARQGEPDGLWIWITSIEPFDQCLESVIAKFQCMCFVAEQSAFTLELLHCRELARSL